MEEGQTVEIQETREPLREQGSIRELLELLEQHGMEQEKGDVVRMADYIDFMEQQLGTVLQELGEVKAQLGVMQESKVKTLAVKTIQQTEQKIQTIRFQVGELKNQFLNRAEQAVKKVKEKGMDVLAQTMKRLKISDGLQNLQSSLQVVILFMDKEMDKLGAMGDELHTAKGHLQNAFGELKGTSAKKVTARDPEKGLIFQTQKVLFQSMRSIHRMEQKTGNLLEKAQKFEDRTGKPASVKAALQEIGSMEHPLRLQNRPKAKETVRF